MWGRTMKILDLAVRLTVASVPVVIVGVLGSLLWLGISAIERSKVLEVAPTEWRPIAAPAPDVRCWQYGYSLTIVCLEAP